ncbi:hypothetical protein PHYPSEUDO_004072 [Phytophthora pseudosyringae]|uniref:RxLR effector protein n=1 Tax=Phytophthora pseudosyringae TaxID=221518 RepID=A0A8T1VU45_9STRA|nr:hypothetical protein PHYPSEUDO_004072 [Phytophthora pseudosyringae]
MRFPCILLLVLACLAAISDAAPITGGSKLSTADFQTTHRSRVFNRPDAADKRRLKTHSAKTEAEEERAIVLPGLAKIKEWFQAFVLKIKLTFSEGRQLGAWQKEKKTPEDVFKLLRLDSGTGNLMANSKLKTWSVYMTMYNNKNPTKSVTMLGMFTKTYGDEAVAKMIEAARRSPKTKVLANQLQMQQLTGWAQNGLSTDIVFQLLKVGEGGLDKLMTNKALNVWFYYFNQMNRHNPDRQVELTKKLLTVYDDIPLAKAFEAATKVKRTEFIGTELQQAQFAKWLADGIDPATIFKSLKMDKVKWGVDPTAEVFRGYKTFYNANKT